MVINGRIKCGRCGNHRPQSDYTPTVWRVGSGYCKPCNREYRSERYGDPVWHNCIVDLCGIRIPPQLDTCADHVATARRPAGGRRLPDSQLTYSNAHQRVRAAHGRPAEHLCAELCGRPAADWAYDGQDPDVLVGITNRGRPAPFSIDPARYRPLCKPCHVRENPCAAPVSPPPPTPVPVRLPSLHPARALVDLRHPPECLGWRKRCPGCEFVKDGGAFTRDRSRTDGRGRICRPCDARRVADAYARRGVAKPAGRTTRTYAGKAVSRRAAYARHRARAVQVYGGRCVWCSATDALEFDHVNNDGAAHRATIDTASWYRMISTSGVPDPDWSIQLLCVPCHRGEGWTERRADGTPAA